MASELRPPGEPDEGHPDPGYEGDIGKARRAVEARGLTAGQDGYWGAVFAELRPDLAAKPAPARPLPGLIPLAQYLRDAVAKTRAGAGAPGTLGNVPANLLAQDTPREGMVGRLQRGIPSLPENAMPAPSPNLYRQPETWPMPQVGPEMLYPRPERIPEGPPYPMQPGTAPGTVQAPAPSVASIRPEELAALLQRTQA